MEPDNDVGVFSVVSLTQEELELGRTFSLANKRYFKSLLAQAANSRLALRMDPANMTQFMLDEAYLKSRIELLQFLLNTSKEDKE